MAWPQLEPETPFVDNWHIGLICELLTAVSLGQLRDLLITVPPRCTKSMTVAVLWRVLVLADRTHSKHST